MDMLLAARWEDMMPKYVKMFEGVLTPELCTELIRRFEADPRVKADPQPDYSTRSYLNLSEIWDWRRQVQGVTQIADPLIADFFRLPARYRAAEQKDWANDGWVLARYRTGDACIFHDDAQSPIPPANGLRLATLIFFLNDVPEGGELYFPLQELKVKPKEGRAVIFPAQVTHPHEVLATGSLRYVLQTWVIDPDLVVVHREEDT